MATASAFSRATTPSFPIINTVVLLALQAPPAATASAIAAMWRRTGDVGPRAQGGDHRSQRIEAHAEEILALVDAMPDITLGEIAAHLDERHGLTVIQSTVWRLLARHGMTFKKNRARERATAS